MVSRSRFIISPGSVLSGIADVQELRNAVQYVVHRADMVAVPVGPDEKVQRVHIEVGREAVRQESSLSGVDQNPPSIWCPHQNAVGLAHIDHLDADGLRLRRCGEARKSEDNRKRCNSRYLARHNRVAHQEPAPCFLTKCSGKYVVSVMWQSIVDARRSRLWKDRMEGLAGSSVSLFSVEFVDG